MAWLVIGSVVLLCFAPVRGDSIASGNAGALAAKSPPGSSSPVPAAEGKVDVAPPVVTQEIEDREGELTSGGVLQSPDGQTDDGLRGAVCDDCSDGGVNECFANPGCHDCETPGGLCFCVTAQTCEGLTACPTGTECAPGQLCCTNTCCGGPVCLSPCAAPNDTCASAEVIGEGTVTGSTVGTTNDGSATCGTSTASPDVWYSYTPPCSGPLVVDTCGSFYDTVLSVHSGCPGTTANELLCNDDFCGLQSRVSLAVAGGTNYLIRVSGFNGASGNFVLNLDLQPPGGNDDCVNSIAVGEGVFPFSNCGASTDGPDEPAACSFFGYTNVDSDIWYCYSPGCSGLATISLCGSAYDTKIAVYPDCFCPVGSAPIACNDDAGFGSGCFGTLQSELSFMVSAGQSYLVRIGGYFGAQGDGTMTITCVETQACCLPDGTCTQTTIADCDALGGFNRGSGSMCAGDSDGDLVDDACEDIICLDTTPPVTELIIPPGLACVCDPVTITGSAYDPDNTFVSYTLEYMYATGGPWVAITSSASPVVNSTLGVWNATGLAQGYYVLRVTATNQCGLSSTAVGVVWLDQVFDTFAIGSPGDGSVLGATACITGTIWDHCFTHYAVDYAPPPFTTYNPVNPGSPVYGSTAINTTLATWDTTTVVDGNYRIRVRAADACGHAPETFRDVVVDNTAPTALISAPLSCEYVEGVVDVIGTASDANLASWALQYTGGDSNGWVTIASGNTEVDNDLLGEWDTTSLRPCAYTLRLLVSDSSGLNCGPFVHQSEYLVSLNVGTCGDFDVDDDGDVDLVDFAAFQDAFTGP